MIQAARKLLHEFDRLADQEPAELLTELIRRATTAPHDLPEDDDLVAAADRLFVELDKREQQ